MFEGGDKIFEDEEEHEMIKGDEGVCNPFMEHMEKAEREDGGIKENKKNEDEEEEPQKMAREETPTPPADAGECFYYRLLVIYLL
nr:unnamed protein product [Callosobruchus analis]